MFCPHCCLENICSICGKEMLAAGCKSYQSNIIWCQDCHNKKKQEQNELEKQEKKNDEHKSISACLNRDYTEKLYRNHFRFQPTKLRALIENHRKNVYKNTRNVIKLNSRQQDYIKKSTEHL